MEPIDFVKEIRKWVVQSNSQGYRKLFNETNIDDATDKYFINALILFNSLDRNQKDILFSIIYQVQVDTVSKIFAILDGVSTMEKREVDFILSTSVSHEKINGDLQDLFLELEGI